MNLKESFMKLCTPAQIYLFIALIMCILALISRTKITIILMKLLFAVIWTIILNFICSKGYTNVSWVLVLLPYVLIFLGMLGMAIKM
jgi:hypothetical protein